MSGVLRLVMGEQVSETIASLEGLDPQRDTVLMAEVAGEAKRWGYHKQKLVLIYAGMRQFAARLQAQGVRVRYVRLGDPESTGSLLGEVLRAAEALRPERIVLTEPSNHALVGLFEQLETMAPVPVEVRADSRFLCSRAEFEAWAKGRSGLRMEIFYRWMRKHTGLLMKDGEPLGGQWNFDAENRKPAKGRRPPPSLATAPNPVTAEVMAEVEARFPNHFGSVAAFGWPTTREEALATFERFVRERLPVFGDHQDAMLRGEPSMWHAHISAALNIGLLEPLEICRRVEAEHLAGRVPINAAEGFIRQIIGWREFIRGVYWREGPAYKTLNALRADRTLPEAYWTGETPMRCVAETVGAVRDLAYAHHIQRLMVTGNLAMLLGVHPDEINDWYMVVFADAFEWVELPNTHGMATFADGGVVGSKPYAASGAYIDRMSDYCRSCAFDVKDRLGERACPFNSLYWDFLMRHERRFANNPRMAMPYRNLTRFSAADKDAIAAKAEAVRQSLGATVRPKVSAGD